MATDQRSQDGTRQDRRDPSVKTRVYFGLAVLVAAAAAYAAGQALVSAHSASNAVHRSNADRKQIAVLVARVAADEAQTCAIQRRGLPAGHELAAAMADIHALLVQPPRPGQHVPAPVAKIVADLNRHLSNYLKAEAKQPETRSCT